MPLLYKPKVGHIHPLTQTINEINDILKRIGYSVMDGPEIETAEDNFVRANLPTDHPAMDLQDSIYIQEPDLLLRTQTTAGSSNQGAFAYGTLGYSDINHILTMQGKLFLNWR